MPRNNESSFTIIEPTPLRKMLISNVLVCALSEDYIMNHYFILEQMMYEKFQENFKPSSFGLIQVILQKHFNITILHVMDQEERNLVSHLQACCDQPPTVTGTEENWPEISFGRGWSEVCCHEGHCLIQGNYYEWHLQKWALVPLA